MRSPQTLAVRPARGAAAGFAAPVLALLALGCASARPVDVDAARNMGGVAIPTDASKAGVEPRLEAAFDAVLAALESGDTQLARRLLGIILARNPKGESLALAERLARVVDGRAVMDACRFALAIDRDPKRPDHSRLRVTVETQLSSPARLDLAPLVVTRTVATLDRLGSERWRTDTFLWELGGALELPERGRTERHVVQIAPLPRGEHLAVREQWSVAARSGFVVFQDRRLPARAFTLEAPSKEWLAGFLDRGPLEPDLFAAFLDDPRTERMGDEQFTACLLERVLRVPLDRRGELLDHMAARAPDLDDRELARLYPALRWLAASSDERDLEQWRRVLAAQIGAGVIEADN